MRYILSVQLLLLLLSTLLLSSQASSKQQRNQCNHASTCSECLEASGECYWCADDGYDVIAGRSRCNVRSMLHDCISIQIGDGDVNNVLNVAFGSKVQVRPQKVKLKLRPGQTQSFTMSVKPAKDYPVRLYYLMDMSNSMKDDLQKLKTLGTKIANQIKSITKDFKLAFGTFVDKTVSPFIRFLGENEAPCAGCEQTFGYKHVFDFNTDATLFEDAVGNQRISGNLDTAEGGFDALMQVATCEGKIKWDPIGESRRIVVFVTDAPPHIAGDGKIGGIITPNDAECHLEYYANSPYLLYDKTNDMDYPSISQLKSVMKEKKIVPIIAVTSDVKPIYDVIADEWKDIGAGIGLLEKDSSNIVDLIRDTYKRITTTVRVNDDSPGNVVVKYQFTSGCSKVGATDEKECTLIATDEQVDLKVSLRATNCVEKWKDGENITITVPGFGDVEVEVSMICECDCEKTGELSAQCSGEGSLQCGICRCNEERYGEKCECDGTSQADTSLCIMPNSTQDIICSGFGSCVCGTCECDRVVDEKKFISGKYCECNNFGCDRYEGKLCGGLERGICKCGQCVCKEAFLGENCGKKNCTLGKKNCEKNGVICSSNGNCNCDTCECKAGCSGTLCETCVTEGPCKHHEDCVKCRFEIAEYCDTCFENDNVTYVKVFENETLPLSECGDMNYTTAEKCIITLDNTREIHYRFDMADGQTTAFMEPCAKPLVYAERDVPIWVIALGIIGGIVGIFIILLLIWKAIDEYFRRHEFEDFRLSTLNPEWKTEQNPIHVKATTSFKNPTFTGNK